MKLSDFDYNLPEELIAQFPIEPRENSRLLVYEKSEIDHKYFYNLADILKDGDVLVVNRTKVLPSRLFGIKQDTGAKIEFLLLKRLNYSDFEVLAKPCKRLAIGTKINFSKALSAEIIDNANFDGGKIVQFFFEGVFENILEEIGEMPLPHYIKGGLKDKNRYNTVYAKEEGSAAAPTAGLHFSQNLIEILKKKGVIFEEVLLSVGLGTFRPVKAENIEEHKMHSETFELTLQTAERLNKYRQEGRRIVAVGTTTVRVLETCADGDGILQPQRGETDIFIYPSYNFKFVQNLITNFHLPKSSLIMLVSAFIGREETMKIYQTAVKERYRFFSFGDAMLLKK